MIRDKLTGGRVDKQTFARWTNTMNNHKLIWYCMLSSFTMPQDMQEFTGDGCTHGQAWLAIFNRSTTCMDPHSHSQPDSSHTRTVHMSWFLLLIFHWLLSEGAWLANSTTTIITPLPQGIPNDRCRQLLSPTESPKLNSQVKSTDRWNHNIRCKDIESQYMITLSQCICKLGFPVRVTSHQWQGPALPAMSWLCDLHPVSPVKSHVQDLFSQGNETSFLEKPGSLTGRMQH